MLFFSQKSLSAAHFIPDKTKKTMGKETALPHILYSAESECGSLSHLVICLSVFGFLDVPIILRRVSNTSRQNAISFSVGFSVPSPEHHQSGKPCYVNIRITGLMLSKKLCEVKA